MKKRTWIIPALLLLLTWGAAAQTDAAAVREAVRSDRTLAYGLDRPYDLNPKTLTPSPKGYEPVYISHYGRHGSRYAYTAKTYTVLLEMLREGREKDNLTARGVKLLEDLEAFWEKGRYQVGDLTPLGWEQLGGIGSTMVHNYPSAFRKGSRVDACSSSSIRSVLSMSSCCGAISREAPKTSVYAHQSILDIQATRPNIGDRNPFRYTGPEIGFPYPENSEEFFLRHFPIYPEVLGRLFKDPSAALGKRSAYDVFFYYYMFIVGMNSLPAAERIEVEGLLTDDELAILWETDNYERFREYLPYRISCSSIVDDIISKADARLSERSRGADLRFGHDHVAMALFMIMDLDGFANIPSSGDDLIGSFQTYRSPMATNIQFIFYTPKRGRAGETLVKVLLNGEEARLGTFTPKDGPYYSWSEAKEYLSGRVALFVNKDAPGE
ncbi:MAG: hypothetical protein IJR77_05210 [Bacteroidales bacterium]|nr:hypothetical protein [Bacteroidales bacterium]